MCDGCIMYVRVNQSVFLLAFFIVCVGVLMEILDRVTKRLAVGDEKRMWKLEMGQYVFLLLLNSDGFLWLILWIGGRKCSLGNCRLLQETLWCSSQGNPEVQCSLPLNCVGDDFGMQFLIRLSFLIHSKHQLTS